MPTDKLLLGSTNPHKLQEIKPLFDELNIALLSLADMDPIPEIEEDGLTFEANAAIKARICFEAFKMPVFADDSGLEVKALAGAPGVYSARYAGEHSDYLANNMLLLKNMQNIPENERQARFVCTVCYKDAHSELYFTGSSEGIILNEFRGTGGFGYDPLFYIPHLGKTYAQLSMEEKNILSHRGKAIAKFVKYLKKNTK